jgi:predicted dehydrogenase
MSYEKSVNRRAFLKKATAFAAGAAASPYFVPCSALGAAGGVSPGNRITLGFLGAGDRGIYINMKAFLQNPSVQVVAVCDVNAGSVQMGKPPARNGIIGREPARQMVESHYAGRKTDGTYKGCDTYVDFRDLLARKDIDAVVISTPDHWHALMAVAAALAGKDIYCEKPLGVSVAGCQAIRDAVRRYGRVFQTGTQQRSDHRFRFACELARNGYLGKVHTIHIGAPGPNHKPEYSNPVVPEPVPEWLDYDMYVGPAMMKPYNGSRIAWPDWYLISDYCAGFIVNWGVHHLDIANWACPEVAGERCDIEATGSYRNEGLTDNINDWRAEFTYASGLRMTFTDAGNPNRRGCQFVGDQGSVYVDRGRISAEPASLLQVKMGPNEIHLYESVNHHNDFINCIRSRRDPVAPIEAGYRASCLGMIAEIAVRVGRRLQWDPVVGTFVDDPEANRLLAQPMRSPWHL